MVNCPKWLGEGAKGLSGSGREKRFAPVQDGVAPVQNRFQMVRKTLGRLVLPGPKDLLRPLLRLLQVAMGGNHLNQLPLSMQTEHAARCRERKGRPVGRMRHCSMRTLGPFAGRAATTAERMGREVETFQGAKKRRCSMPPEAVTSPSLRQLLLESGQTSIRALLLE